MATFLDTFPFAIFVVSVLSTKFLHLFLHANSIPLFNFLIYLPSFFVPDVIIICIGRVLLRRERSVLSTIGYIFGLTLTIVTLGAASSQLGFYIETGGEIEWEDAGAFAGDEEGMKVLMDGVGSVVLSTLAIFVVAWCLKPFLHRLVGDFLVGLGNYIVSAWKYVRYISSDDMEADLEEGDDNSTVYSEDRESLSDLDAHERQQFLENVTEKQSNTRPKPTPPHRSVTIAALTALLYLFIVPWFRPEKPYNHMSTTLPMPLLEAYQPTLDPCEEQVLLSQNEWPLPNLTSKAHWKTAKGDFKGWAPGVMSKASTAYRQYHPEWLPQPVPKGFARWDPEQSKEDEYIIKPGQTKNKEVQVDNDSCAVNVTEDNFYSPVTDPLRITNLDNDMLGPLKEVLKDDSVKIKHVMFILMESMREELFPIQQGSDIHKFVVDTHEDDERKAASNSRLAKLTPNAERITGKSGNFHDAAGKPYEASKSNWDDKTKPGFGGINVVGGFTPSSVSTKSLAALHCGAWPLPVDKFEEADLESYQPCMPQILDLFNQHKDGNDSRDDFLQQEWAPAFFQATTDHYDRQSRFDEKIGFEHIITKTALSGKRLGEPIKEINYFGYPETALKPYLEEYINQTLSENKRMFLSHFTSTTHHPWALPDDFEATRYMSLRDGHWHNDMNNYLNTVRFVDTWLGEVMQMLNDYGIENETLVVFVGDHGQAFKEDTKKSGTYENGHVSNFRVPITLRHPLLPRVQYEANATSISLLPTVLDLLINTKSLNEQDLSIASDIIHDYEGQSLIRPYKTKEDGRRAWNFGLVNSGGGMLTVTSADAPWRLVIPLGLEVSYTFTDLKNDPLELSPTSDWSLEALLRKLESTFGADAAVWAKEAEAVSKWWILERKKLWGYNKSG